MRRALFILGFASSILVTHPSAAQPAAAQTLFEEGRRLMAAGSYAEACPKFAASNRLDPGAGTLLNLALCYEKNEQLASAWVTYTEAAAYADRSGGRQDWAKKGKEKAAALAPQLSTLTIVVPQAARIPGLTIRRDGHAVSEAEWGVKVPVDGGDHEIEARAPDHETVTKTVRAPSSYGSLTLDIPELAMQKPDDTGPAPSPKARPGSTQRTVGVVLAIAGVAGMGAGGFFAYRASSKHDDARTDCNADETRCGPAGLASYDSARTSADIATVAFIAGAAFVVAGAVLYLTATPRKARSPLAHAPAFGWSF